MSPREFAIEVVRKLQTAGHQAVWAGGCVRDALLGREPKDYDVATSAPPNQVRELFGYKHTLAIGEAFGVISVMGPRSAGPIEVATFRRDGGYSDGRHPDSVEFTDAKEDALRRDFSINGMFLDPLKEEVIDFVGGQDDLKAKIVRAIGNPAERIDEDKLRMLRGVRFAATFDFEIESGTFAAIQRHAEQIKVVSAERIGNEVRRMLEHSGRVQAVQLLLQTNLLSQILPTDDQHVLDIATIEARGLASLRRLEDARFESVLITLLEPLFGDGNDAPRAVRYSSAIQNAWRLTNDQQASLAWLGKHWRPLHQADSLPWPEIQRLLIHEDAASAVSIANAILGDSVGLEFCRDRLAWPPEKLNPPPLIDGKTLINHGISPGPAFKAVLHNVRNAQLDGKIESVAAAVELALSLAQQFGKN